MAFLVFFYDSWHGMPTPSRHGMPTPSRHGMPTPGQCRPPSRHANPQPAWHAYPQPAWHADPPSRHVRCWAAASSVSLGVRPPPKLSMVAVHLPLSLKLACRTIFRYYFHQQSSDTSIISTSPLPGGAAAPPESPAKITETQGATAPPGAGRSKNESILNHYDSIGKHSSVSLLWPQPLGHVVGLLDGIWIKSRPDGVVRRQTNILGGS